MSTPGTPEATTETPQEAARAKQIRERLNEIAPYPRDAGEVTAAGLARYLAMRAQVIWSQQLGTVAPWSRRDVDLMTVLFAASHALRALDVPRPVSGGKVAREIWHAWDDGASIGEWLWQYLGDEACQEIGTLAEELAALETKPAAGLLAHAGPIRSALLNSAAAEGVRASARQSYLDAVVALDRELATVSGEEPAP